jgi:D-3-phosphoglycerate dehydrogenase
MYQIKTLNKISEKGLALFDSERYSVGEDIAAEDAVLVRSANLLEYSFPESLMAISRAGVGVNNIPISRCSEAGIAVFNTPGANANAVKELVLCAMLMGSRDVDGSIRWVRKQVEDGVDVTTVVEKGKSAFVGPELY